MPTYPNPSLYAPKPEMAIPGKPSYFYGAFPSNQADTVINISSVALTSNFATVVGTIVSGNIPVAGQLISIAGLTNAAFNVSNVAIASASATTAGVSTVTFALTHADVSATADAGMALVPVTETAETLANNTSVAIYVPGNELRDEGEKCITVSTTFPTMPTAATVTLYEAIVDNPSEYTSVGTVAVVSASSQTTGPVKTYAQQGGRFYRLVVSGVSGTGAVISKMVC